MIFGVKLGFRAILVNDWLDVRGHVSDFSFLFFMLRLYRLNEYEYK